MCSAIVILFDRQPAFKNKSAWVLAHAGRITTYSIFGFLLGAFGQTLWSFNNLQAILSILFALIAFYMASAFIGLTPSPELFFASLTQRWGRLVRTFNSASPLTPYLLGAIWGLLPCGLVLTALVTAIASGSAINGVLNMLVFGFATIPSLLTVRWLADKSNSRIWSRSLASLVMMLFGFQFAMRGFAFIGIVEHFMLGKVMLW